MMLPQVVRSSARATRLAPQAAKAAGVRFASSKSIHDELAEIIPERQELAKKLKTQYADAKLGDVTVSHVFGGMRGLKAMVWDPSVLDAEEGIRFWGRSIPECQEVLPAAHDGKEMLPESMFWYLLTGKVPTREQVDDFQADLAQRSTKVPAFVNKMLDNLPKDVHPMTQFVMAIAALNSQSKFAKAYSAGMKKSEYWKTALEDSLDLAALAYPVAARIYSNKYRGGASNIPQIDTSRDLSWNFAQQTGFGDSKGFIEVIRLYNALHTDHEGGNVSAHTTHLVGSALSDPYLSYAAALAGLAGPLHGLANQEALKFVLEMKDKLGGSTDHEKVKGFLWDVLKTRVVPGYGHAVLRKPDPRFQALRDFGNKYEEIAKDPVFQMVDVLFQVAPGVLTEHGKTKNPFPNVDAASGSLLYHFGLNQYEFYTVVFGCSRAMGGLSQLVWDRALGFPIERPKSLSMEAIAKLVGA